MTTQRRRTCGVYRPRGAGVRVELRRGERLDPFTAVDHPEGVAKRGREGERVNGGPFPGGERTCNENFTVRVERTHKSTGRAG